MMVAGLLNPTGDCEFTGGFQARFGILVAQSQDSQCRVIALLFYAHALEDTPNNLCGVYPDGARPVPDA